MDAAHLARITRLGRAGYWSLILWIPLAITAGMAFDHPKSREWFGPWLYFAAVLILPIAVLIAPFLARHHLSWGRIRLAYAIVLLPQSLLYLPVTLSLLWMVFWLIYNAF
jgi:hypothetical protein